MDNGEEKLGGVSAGGDRSHTPAHQDKHEVAALRDELAAVKQQLRETEQREKRYAALYQQERKAHAESVADLKALAESEQVYRAIGETFRFGIWTATADGTPRYISPSFLELLDLTLEEVTLQMARQLRSFDKSRARLHPEDAESFRDNWLRSMKTGADLSAEHRVTDREGQVHSVQTRGRAVRDENGEIVSWAGTNLDITELKQDEEEIRRQAETIHELSTPVLEISTGLLIVPLIGPINAQRATDLTEQLLHGVRRTRAKTVVVDVTGVPRVDSFVANHLIKTAEACRLMGAQVILTGISTAIAETLTEVGVEMTGVTTAGDLRSGIDLAQRLLTQQRA